VVVHLARPVGLIREQEARWEVWVRRLSIRRDRCGSATGPAEFAWQVHAALESWTARADLKASILLALQGGAFIVAVTSQDAVFGRVRLSPALVSLAALGVLLAAMAMAAAATLPVLGSPRRLRRERAHSLVYFGHLRLWPAADLAARLAALTTPEQVDMLSAQLVAMSRLTWRKHRLLQGSVALTVVVLLALAAATVSPCLDGW
jgi:hypothetical protein